MNPITQTRYGLVRYVVLWGLLAAAWAVVWGLASAMPAGQAAICGAVFGAVSGFEGLILWNVLKYGVAGTPTDYAQAGMPATNFWRLGRLATLVVAGTMFTVVAVGAEVLALWATTGGVSVAFAATIPARVLSAAAVYVCFVQWYRSASPSEVERPEPEAEPEADSAPGSVETIERITVRGAGGRIEVIDLERIVCIEAEGDYVAIVTPDGRWLKEGTMKYFESALPRARFVRVHRSCIVAVGHISRIETSGRDHYLILHSGGGNAHGELSSGWNGRRGRVIRISEAGYRVLKQTLGL